MFVKLNTDLAHLSVRKHNAKSEVKREHSQVKIEARYNCQLQV